MVYKQRIELCTRPKHQETKYVNVYTNLLMRHVGVKAPIITRPETGPDFHLYILAQTMSPSDTHNKGSV